MSSYLVPSSLLCHIFAVLSNTNDYRQNYKHRLSEAIHMAEQDFEPIKANRRGYDSERTLWWSSSVQILRVQGDDCQQHHNHSNSDLLCPANYAASCLQLYFFYNSLERIHNSSGG